VWFSEGVNIATFGVKRAYVEKMWSSTIPVLFCPNGYYGNRSVLGRPITGQCPLNTCGKLRAENKIEDEILIEGFHN
jgi:hypothetical protein